MTSCSEEALKKLNKGDLIGIAWSLSSKIKFPIKSSKVLEGLKLLNDKFDKLETNVAITRTANSLLPSRLVHTKRQCWANTLYSRREISEIVGLPKSLTNNEAETKVCQIFRSLDCSVNKEDLDACQWLKDKEPVIVNCKVLLVLSHPHFHETSLAHCNTNHVKI